MSQQPGSPDAVYFLLHVPKTAGQTIEEHLRAHMAPSTYCEPGQRWARLARRGIRPGGLPRDAQVLAGHWLTRRMGEWFPGREIRRAVLLRDPVDLQISLYNFRMMSNLGRGLPIYSFALHQRALGPNFLTHFLLGRWLGLSWATLVAMPDDRKYDLLNRTLATFWFVGSFTDCNRLIALLAPALDVPPAAQRRNSEAEWRAQVRWEPLTRNSLSPSDRDRTITLNPLDQALWESWKDAGLDAGRVTPQPFQGAWRRSRWHLAIQPLFEATRFLVRDWSRWSTLGQAAMVARADRARNKGAWILAAKWYRRALWRNDALPAIWLQYARALTQSGMREAAIEAYRRSLLLKSDHPIAQLELGVLLARMGDTEAAESALRAAAALDPECSEATTAIAMLTQHPTASTQR